MSPILDQSKHKILTRTCSALNVHGRRLPTSSHDDTNVLFEAIGSSEEFRHDALSILMERLLFLFGVTKAMLEGISGYNTTSIWYTTDHNH